MNRREKAQRRDAARERDRIAHRLDSMWRLTCGWTAAHCIPGYGDVPDLRAYLSVGNELGVTNGVRARGDSGAPEDRCAVLEARCVHAWAARLWRKRCRPLVITEARCT